MNIMKESGILEKIMTTTRVYICMDGCAIQKLMVCGFELDYNTGEATKSTYAKDEGAVDHCTRIKLFKKFRSSCSSMIR